MDNLLTEITEKKRLFFSISSYLVINLIDMPINISINDSEIPGLVKYYEQRIQDGNKIIAEGNQIVKDAQSMLDILNKSRVKTFSHALMTEKTPPFIDNGYNDQWSWGKKIDFILQDRTMTTAEIADKILEYESGKGIERSKIVANVSAVLTSKISGARYLRQPNSRGIAAYRIKQQQLQ